MSTGGSPATKVRALAVTAFLAAVVAAYAVGIGHPVWFAPLALAAGVLVTETAVVHLKFGQQRWTFSLTEGVIAAAFVYSPSAWVAICVVVGVTLAQLFRRQEALKVQFNVAQFAAATSLGAALATVLGGGVTGAIAGMGVFWLVNNVLIAAAVSAMSGQPMRQLVLASAPLAAVHSVGTSGIGVLAAWLVVNGPYGLFALVVPLLLLWLSYDEQTTRAAEVGLFADLARLQERASGRSVDMSAQIVLTAAARLFNSSDVEMVLIAEEGPVRYSGDEQGANRHGIDHDVLDADWVLRALAGHDVACGLDAGQPWCSTVLGRGDAPQAILIARRSVGVPGFGRRELTLAQVLRAQAESWLSLAEVTASRDEAVAHAVAAEDAARALGDLGADTAPSLGVLRESANRLARLAATVGPASVGEIVDELYAVERAVASLLGAIALAAEPDLNRLDEPDAPKRGAEDWTTTGVLAT